MVNPEKIADIDEGTQSELDIGGMTADEQAAWDAMKGGRDIPAGGDNDDGKDPPAGDVLDASDDDDDPGSDLDQSAGDGAREEPVVDPQRRQAPKTISYGKYQRESKKAQDAAAALQAKLDGAIAETRKEREERLRLDERTKMLLDAISAKPKAQEAKTEDTDPEPNGEEDPLGHAAWTSRELRRTQKIITDIQSGQTRQQADTKAERDAASLYNTFEADLRQEATTDPTFPEVFNHLRESRYRELGFIYAGIDINDVTQCNTLSPQDQSVLSQNIQRAFHNEQMLVAKESLSRGIRPAKVVANLARARGYVPKAAETPKPNGKSPNGTGSSPQIRMPANGQARPSVGEELQAIRDGQANSKSLSDAGGSPGGTITPERLGAMTEEEFEEFYESIPKNQFDRLMGKIPQ